MGRLSHHVARLAILPLAALLAAATPAEERAAALSGTWTVDLRVDLADEPYSQPMVLSIAADGAITGSFYNSEILAGRAGSAQGRTCVAFRTTDGQGLYHTSACLVDGKMVGQTWAEGRNFVLPWTATRG
ncbi:hypothetical protein [Erythrobacter neustonensis]|uniref:Extracellular endo-alpha-(1->5)-L-arabinanase C-terminal domain-containing protein n=1 Tax=Erythrobacter neustonensis TaxID=1112 RepID=A0A192D521_9SPHN|nr:hypothetical protein [Erythrobacter neustonensis]ANK13131.1 hypothetical protein A9D12_09440 [Erythrobacter neustonensis]